MHENFNSENFFLKKRRGFSKRLHLKGTRKDYFLKIPVFRKQDVGLLGTYSIMYTVFTATYNIWHISDSESWDYFTPLQLLKIFRITDFVKK